MPDADGSACPGCGRKRDTKLRCWKCFNRPCLECGVLTGGAFFPYCVPHQGVVPDEPEDVQAPAPDPEVDRWVLVLEAEPGSVPPAIRVRQILKYAKRRQGMRCVALPATVPDEADVDTVLEDEEWI